jgi:hypothetical protein
MSPAISVAMAAPRTSVPAPAWAYYACTMAYTQRPCACGGTNFHYLPGVNVFYGASTNMAKGWTTNLVVCTSCGRTEAFTQNADQIARNVPGATTISAGQY